MVPLRLLGPVCLLYWLRKLTRLPATNAASILRTALDLGYAWVLLEGAFYAHYLQRRFHLGRRLPVHSAVALDARPQARAGRGVFRAL